MKRSEIKSFARVMNEIFDSNSGITKASEIAVYAALASFADNSTRKANPRIKLIAERANVSDRTARDCLKKLKETNFIKIESSFNDFGQSSNIYTLLDRK